MIKINNTLLAVCVIGFSVFFQVHCAIHGFDLTDEGYLMSIYQWFGTDNYYAQGAGGYPLTGYIGWLLNNIYPDGGILGMRLWGILLVTLTIIIFYNYLKRYFSPKMVLAGLLMQSLFVAQDPKPFGYNTLTALFAGVALISIIEGTLHNKKWLLLAGGLLLGFNIFVRIPNLSCLSFLIIPCFYNFKSWKDMNLKQSTVQVSTIVAGAVISSVLVWLFLMSIGADRLVIDLVASIGDTLGGKSTHGSSSLIAKYSENLLISVEYFVVFAVAILIASASHLVKPKWLKLVVWFLAFQVIYRSTYLYTSVLGDATLGMMNGLGIFGGCVYLFQGKVEKKIIALSAILFSLIIPLGSDGGFQTMWVGTWLSLPVGLSGLYHFVKQAKEQQWTLVFGAVELESVKGKIGNKKIRISSPADFKTAYYICLFSLFLAVAAKVENRAYYDPGHKSKKTFAIDSPLAKGVYASQERADIINPLLAEIRHYVKPGDTMLVYDSSPLLCYLTKTKPFAGISWPCVFYGDQYVHKFREAEQNMDRPPVIVMQNFWTSNKWGKPKASYYSSERDAPFSTKEMVRNTMSFIKRHHYQIVWSNRYYHIMMPTNSHNTQSE